MAEQKKVLEEKITAIKQKKAQKCDAERKIVQ